MGYVKPGVEVRQEQKSNSPVLITPDLEACVVGHSYKWIDPTLDSSVIGTSLVGTDDLVFTLSGNNPDYYDVSTGNDDELVVVDVLGISGNAIGLVKHLLYGTDYTVAANVAGTQVTILSGATTVTGNYQVRVGYRALDTVISKGFKSIVSTDDIKETLGEIVSWNPLAYGAAIAMSNSASAIKALKLNVADSFDTSINDYLGLEEVYAIAPLTHKATASALKTHCATYSAAAEKKERIAFVNNYVTYGADPKTLDSTAKDTLASTLRDNAIATQEKRVFQVNPDAGYVVETRHISTIKPSWIAASFLATTDMPFDTNNLVAKFVSDKTIDGVKYKAGTLITETLWATLVNSSWAGSDGLVSVLAPVPGYYFTAQAVGQVIGTPVSQPLTNVPGTGLAETFGSQDIFSETQLNTIASGGNWIYVQKNKTGAISCRHQMSTDVTSVAKRELSITKALDYSAKFIRNGLSPYIGRYNITPAFLKLVETILNGSARFLVREGHIEDMKIINVKQDDVSPDTINVDLSIKVLYPVNYIKVTLIF